MSSPFSYTLSPIVPLGASSNTDPRVALLARIDAIAIRDWAYDFERSDIAVPRRIVRGADAILQRYAIRCRFFLGEWFLDQRLGVPWYQRILIKAPDLRIVKRLFEKTGLTIKGVSTCTVDSVKLNSKTRRLSIEGVTITLSDVATLRVEGPFIL